MSAAAGMACEATDKESGGNEEGRGATKEVAGRLAMETFGKGGRRAAEPSATVRRMRSSRTESAPTASMRRVMRLGGLATLLVGGLAAAVVAGGNAPAGGATGTTT